MPGARDRPRTLRQSPVVRVPRVLRAAGPSYTRAVIAKVDGLRIHYGKRLAVDGLSFELAAGEIVLLLGPNGAGKSTTLSAIAGSVLPTSGTIEVGGEDLARAPRSARRRIGFADQPPALYEYFTVAEHVGFVAQARGSDQAAADAILAELGLSKIANRPCRELSFGMRQRSPPRSSARPRSCCSTRR
jgi:ABC-2 type transport system ATP-binding protein